MFHNNTEMLDDEKSPGFLKMFSGLFSKFPKKGFWLLKRLLGVLLWFMERLLGSFKGLQVSEKVPGFLNKLLVS